MKHTRRDFLKIAATTGGAVALTRWPFWAFASSTARIALIKTDDRRDGVMRSLRLVENSAHRFPASTHEDTLRALIEVCRSGGAREIIVADRAGMGQTTQVMREKGLDRLAGELGVRLVPLETLPATEWTSRTLPGGNWSRGVLYPKLLEEADVIISTCCLKTHRFGGHFTMALKNSVGMVARQGPDGHDYMRELHGSPRQRAMIAELNTLYRPAMVVLDGIEAFTDAGPEAGRLARPGVVLAGVDRIALDAVGVALLRIHGVGAPVAAGLIFDQEQIRRAVELGLGVTGPGAIDLVSDSAEGRAVVAQLTAELARG